MCVYIYINYKPIYIYTYIYIYIYICMYIFKYSTNKILATSTSLMMTQKE